MTHKIIFAFLTLSVFHPLFGQDHPCPDAIYNNYIEQAEKLKETDFRKALAKYYAARDWCPGLSKEVDGLITKMFEELEAQRAEAKRQERTALLKTKEAGEALKKLEDATSQVFSFLMQEADDLILRLDYEGALEKAKASIPLQLKPRELERRLIEIAYFFNEAGKIERAIGILDTIFRQVRRETPPALPSTSISAIRNELKSLEPMWFDTLHSKRYYPELILIKGGSFEMGLETNEETICGFNFSDKKRTVEDFFIAKTETTVWQYFLFCQGSGIDFRAIIPPGWGWYGDNPMVNVALDDVAQYCNWFSQQIGQQPPYFKFYNDSVYEENGVAVILIRNPSTTRNSTSCRIPTEMEWEYAARGGIIDTPSAFSGSQNLDQVGWFSGNSRNRTQSVGMKNPNELGLFDMSGNVEEWCLGSYFDGFQQQYFPDKSEPVKKRDSKNNFYSHNIYVRGGSWFHDSIHCRVDCQYHWHYLFKGEPFDRLDYRGFRIAKSFQ